MGNTYPHRGIIKQFGGYFLSSRKIWRLPYSEENCVKVKALCLKHGGGAFDEPQTNTLDNKSKTALTTPLLKKASPRSNPVTSALSLSELLFKVSQQLKATFASPIWVFGEIQNIAIKKQSVYLTLAEKNPELPHTEQTVTIEAVIWPKTYQKLCKQYTTRLIEAILTDGLSICAYCDVSIYKARGRLSLVIEDIDPNYTQGALALAREHVLAKIRQQGLDQTNKNTFLTSFPFKIGLISAENSRAKHDFCHQLLSLGFPGLILFAPAAMQGEHTLSEVKSALQLLTANKCDVIVFTRGGGSLSDLRWFDMYDLSKLVAQSPIPIISAIGHHDDVSIVEEISYARCKTPTAAADFILFCFQTTKTRIEKLTHQLSDQLSHRQRFLTEKQQQLSLQLNHIANLNITHSKHNHSKNYHKIQLFSQYHINSLEKTQHTLISKLEQFFDQYLNQSYNDIQAKETKLEASAEGTLTAFHWKLQQLLLKVKTSDPKPWMEKGWTQLAKQHKKITSILHLAVDDTLTARLLDGNVALSVSKILKKKATKP